MKERNRQETMGQSGPISALVDTAGGEKNKEKRRSETRMSVIGKEMASY